MGSFLVRIGGVASGASTLPSTATADESGPPTDEHGGSSDHDDHDHHRSRWPLVSAGGAGALYVGVALAVLGSAAGVVPPLVGVVLAVVGALVAAAGLFGWLEEAYLRGYERRTPDGRSRRLSVTTMLIFLGTDLSTFAAGFIYYASVRVGAWSTEGLPPLLGSLVVINTILLLSSSVTFHVAHEALVGGNRRRFERLLGATLVLGVVFLVGQAYEYYEFVVHEGFTVTDGVFASAFFGLTGLHGLHVALGVVLISIVFARARRGQYGPERDTSVETVALYWHFVDAVWLVLVGVLYVGAVVTF